MPEEDIECEYFPAIAIDSILIYDKKCYLQVYLEDGVYKLVNKQMINYLEKNYFGG